MKRLAFLAGAVCVCSAQTTAPLLSFEAVDIQSVSAFARKVASPVIIGNRYEYRSPNMVDLIATAYNVPAEKVLDGPLWVEYDRYDVIARIPPNTSPERVREMLQTVLVTRFGLVTRQETRLLNTVALVAGKKLQMKPTDGSPAGCKRSMTGTSEETAEFQVDCHDLTTGALAEQLLTFPGGGLLTPMTVQETGADRTLTREPILDRTELTGGWDFTFKLPMAGSNLPGTLPAALEKQLGLKLEPAQASFPVLVIVKVNRSATPNSARDVVSLAVTPEFEVARIKRFDSSNTTGLRVLGLRFPPGGRGSQITITGVPLGYLITQAWNLPPDKLVGGPKWLDNDRWEITAKLPEDPKTGAPIVTAPDGVWPMVRTLLTERFKLTTHFEQREVTAYKLVAVKPKLNPADPNRRSKCFDGPEANGKDPRKANPMLTRLVSCHNLTMDQFAVLIETFSWGYFADPVVNATNLEGTWDATLNFSPWNMIEGKGAPGSFVNGVRQGGGMRPPGDAGTDAAAPSGALSIFDAMEKQLGLKLEPMKRTVQVMVIDHVEQNPTEN
ncbi:MAG: hypothetical protein JWN34_2079 [Bryobacterales bacterium]|nr:hypothetical protein [Bryobacterales bacterium]